MKIETILYNIYYMTNISLAIYKDDIKTYETNPLPLPEGFKADIEKDRLMMVHRHRDDKIIRVQNNYGLCYISIYHNLQNILFGPFLINDDFENQIVKAISNYRLLGEDIGLIESFYHDLMTISEPQQLMIINFLLNCDKLSNQNLKIYNIQSNKNDEEIFTPNKYTIFDNQRIIAENDIERKLMEIIRNGDVDLAENISFNDVANHILYSVNQSFTNMKTSLYIFNSLSNREAVRAGVDLILAYKISMNIKFAIKRLNGSSELRKVGRKIVVSYAKAVRDYTLIHYSNNIKKVILFIRKNLTKDFNLDDIAKELFITKEHLSRLFKKEMGITISEYIINSKIHEAKSLLTEHDYNIVYIADLLNFANSSHFSNSFKKIVGVSPTEYKKNLSK
ncbi:MAG: AraC family transcriptional regulator [Candidatus Izemoplasmatales bacterium]